MKKHKLIVFEGIDNSGKTTLSRKFKEFLETELPMEWWVWAKEPDFSTEEADRLNDKNVSADEYKREALFLESRGRRQALYQDNNVVLDRYLWTGMAYAKVFSPSVYPFAREMYSGSLFFQPDLYVFVDTPVDVCDQRDPSVGKQRLNSLREAYLETRAYVKAPVITCQSVGSVEESLSTLIQLYRKQAPASLLTGSLPPVVGAF